MLLNNMFPVKFDFLPVLLKLCLYDHRKCHFLSGLYDHRKCHFLSGCYGHSLVPKVFIMKKQPQSHPGKNFQLDSNYFAFLS